MEQQRGQRPGARAVHLYRCAFCCCRFVINNETPNRLSDRQVESNVYKNQIFVWKTNFFLNQAKGLKSLPLNGDSHGGAGVLDQFGSFAMGHCRTRTAVDFGQNITATQFATHGHLIHTWPSINANLLTYPPRPQASSAFSTRFNRLLTRKSPVTESIFNFFFHGNIF